ncbi:hypothetical protein P7H20_07270 [Paenibacillus larvae]|nr:hypothetical protein [Paenibacillus larvae]MDT2274699.1 hypothetical protein [Paenibacillus larvae]
MRKNDTRSLSEGFFFLKERDVKDAVICTELLLQHLFGWERSTLLLRWGEVFPHLMKISGRNW